MLILVLSENQESLNLYLSEKDCHVVFSQSPQVQTIEAISEFPNACSYLLKDDKSVSDELCEHFIDNGGKLITYEELVLLTQKLSPIITLQ